MMFETFFRSQHLVPSILQSADAALFLRGGDRSGSFLAEFADLRRSAIGRMLTKYLGEPKGPVLPGCFCSELVAKFFQQIDVPMFSKDVSPQNISPNDLRSCRSLLTVVPNAFLRARDITDDAVGWVPKCDVLQMELRGRHLPGLVRSRAAEEISGRSHDEAIERAMKTVERLEEAKIFLEKMNAILRASRLDGEKPNGTDRPSE